MSIPTAYSEIALAEYMEQVLGRMAGRLNWAVGEHSYDEIVNDTLILYGEHDVSLITGVANVESLRKVARFCVWRAAAEQLSADYDFATDGQRFDRSQMQKAAAEARDLAEADLITAGVGAYAPRVFRPVYIHDPYSMLPDDERARP